VTVVEDPSAGCQMGSVHAPRSTEAILKKLTVGMLADCWILGVVGDVDLRGVEVRDDLQGQAEAARNVNRMPPIDTEVPRPRTELAVLADDGKTARITTRGLAQWCGALGTQHSYPVGPARWSRIISRSPGAPSCRAKAQAICKRNKESREIALRGRDRREKCVDVTMNNGRSKSDEEF
jgi:hypothetical protein